MLLNKSLNYLDRYLEVKILPQKTVINYFCDDTLSYTHEHDIGMSKIEEENISKIILSSWISNFIEVLHKISLHDRVPNHIYLHLEKYPSIFESLLRDKETYSHFYLEEDKGKKSIHVIINKINFINTNNFSDPSIINKDKKSYERYTKTISQFKF